MSDKAVKELLAKVIELHGFRVSVLSERAGKRTADLMAEDSCNRYFIEIKTKLDSDDVLRETKEGLYNNAVYMHEEQTGRTNTMAGVVERAVEQLAASAERLTDIRLIWFVASGLYQPMQIEHFRSTLYGNVDLFDVDNPNTSRPCFYFTFNEFFPHKDGLDGAIVGSISAGTFLLNNFSPRYNAVRQSRLYHVFGDGVCDPQALETKGDAYIADCDADRRDKFAVLGYLRHKYGIPKLWGFSISQHTAFMTAIPTSEIVKLTRIE